MENLAAFYHDKRVLLTGHTGFKGSWLTEWLLMMGAKVTGLSLPPPTQPALFDQLGLAGRCTHVLGDIRDRDVVRKVVVETRPDLVFHLAAQSLVRLSYAQPVETYATNVQGTVHVLDALRTLADPCAAVFITTDKVYENREWLHGYRESDPLGGFDPYSSSKGCAELAIQSFRQSYFNPAQGMPRTAIASARAGNVIGGGDWAMDRILPDAVRALAHHEAIPVRNPNATRPWQHVLEPLSGYLFLGMRLHNAVSRNPQSDHRSPASALRPSISDLCSAFNFGPELSSNRTVHELVEELLKHWSGRWEDRSDPRSPHEAGLLDLATDKAYHLLDWRPRWDFARTIAETVTWYRMVHEQTPAIVPQLVQQQITAYNS
ncbi:MAG: CDP-glucose 4,6-dehydratase [Kiritimatiellaeota bacterium]|nr:CDP-glucose 4,6-dehydratase [Kiritimatiellota bacterium]